MKLSTSLSLAGLFALAIPMTGCIIATDAEPTHSGVSGLVTVDYTISGSTDPALCDTYGVTDVELVVYEDRGAYVTERYAPCEDFWVSVNLDPGLYNADLTLVDAGNRAMSITKPLYSIDVYSDAELVIDVDFPPDSMLY